MNNIELITTPLNQNNLIEIIKFVDGVVLGVNELSTRIPFNIDINHLDDYISICRESNVKLYLALNNIYHEDDLQLLGETMSVLRNKEISGIYFSDLGVYQLAKEKKLINKLVYNPDTLVTNYEIANFMNSKHIKRIVISKEMTLEDILMFGEKSNITCEILIHGYYPMFYSRRKLVSNYFKYIERDYQEYIDSHNIFMMEELRDELMPIYEDITGTHIFSAKKLCALEYLDKFYDNNILHLRINGLFMSEDELINIVKIYHKAKSDFQESQENYNENKINYLDAIKEVNDNISSGFLFKKTIYKT